MSVVIVGAGGHGQVVADILLAMSGAELGLHPIGYVDDDVLLAGRQLLGLPVLGVVQDCATIPHEALIVAIGDNAVRTAIFHRQRTRGERFAIAQHPTAVIARGVQIEPGTVICAGAILNPGAYVGHDAIVNTGAIVEHHCSVADHVHIAPGARLGGEVSVGEGTLVGIGSTILPGIQVGSRCVIGGGAVVTSHVTDNSVVTGVPARTVRTSSAEWAS